MLRWNGCSKTEPIRLARHAITDMAPTALVQCFMRCGGVARFARSPTPLPHRRKPMPTGAVGPGFHREDEVVVRTNAKRAEAVDLAYTATAHRRFVTAALPCPP